MGMKKLRFFLVLVLFVPLVAFTQNVSKKVEVYYFHNTSRCITCKTVEAEAKLDVETLYPDFVKTGDLSFTSLNLEEEKGKLIAGKLGVSGQTLLLVKGESKIDITNEGFLYARTNPVKFKKIIKEKMDQLLDL